MKIKVSRFSDIPIKAKDLSLQPCNWGGQKGKLMLCFVPSDNKEWLDRWKIDLYKRGSRIKTEYTLTIPFFNSLEEMIASALLAYTTPQEWEKYMMISLASEENGYSIAEIRLYDLQSFSIGE